MVYDDMTFDGCACRPELEDNTTSGPRSIILTIKDLTPKQPINPEPMGQEMTKYDKATKTVASQRAVYEGSIGDVSKIQGRGPTAISKVVKSAAPR